MLGRVVEGGPEELERFLADDPQATELLYDKFHDYRAFAEGYDCPLASDGGVAVTRQVEIAPGRVLRFVGLNSALLCTRHGDDEGKLLIGGRQHVLPRSDGYELVVLCHHPLKSLQDHELASRYIRSRARVHIYGHVHEPTAGVESHVEDADLLTMSAGAVVPPNTENCYQYTYNLLSFEWDAKTEGLRVQIVPRTWNEQATSFDADARQFGTDRFQHILRCPNFRSQVAAASVHGARHGARIGAMQDAPPSESLSDAAGGNAMGISSDLLRLYFFRDLSAGQRIHGLIEVGLLPDDWTFDLTHAVERRLFDKALSSGLEDQLASAVRELRTASVAAERGEEA